MKIKAHNDRELLAAFAAAFVVQDYNIYGRPTWPPFAFPTPAAEYHLLARSLPSVLPPLYEKLVLSYRWPEVGLPAFALYPNPPGPLIEGILMHMRADNRLWNTQISAGYLAFGSGAGGCYDRVCFDTNRRLADGDCPIVQIDHEQVLCYEHVRIVSELAESFRSLVMDSIRPG